MKNKIIIFIIVLIKFLLVVFLLAEQYLLSGLAALRLSAEAFPTESLSVIDGNFQWSDRAFEVMNVSCLVKLKSNHAKITKKEL